MTKQRMREIALIFMKERLSRLGVKSYSDALRRIANADAKLIREWLDPADNKHYPDIGLQETMDWLLHPGSTVENSKNFASYGVAWMKLKLATERIRFSNNLRREIGNIATKHGISKVQAIECYRLLVIEVVNHQLRQTEEEIALFVSQG